MSKEASERKPLSEPENIPSDSVLDDIADQLGLELFAKGVRNELCIAVRRYALDQKNLRFLRIRSQIRWGGL